MINESVMYAGRSDCGLKRNSNQDSFLAADLTRSLRVESTNLSVEPPSRLCGGSFGQLFIVADGMGGHRAGNRASQLAINFFATNLLNSMRWTLRPNRDDQQPFVAELKAVVLATHRAIIAESKSTSEYKGMGTTLTAAYVVWPQMWIVHAGDTRCYLYRNHQLRQLTKDHTMANQLLEQGALSAEDAIQSHWASVLWNAIGADGDEVIVDTHQVELAPGDRVLLCSDGLNKHVDDLAISKLLQDIPDPELACQSLIEQANSRGGTDNITAIVANYGPYLEPQLITSIVPSIENEEIWEDLSRFGSATNATGVWPNNAMNNPEPSSSNSSRKIDGDIETLDY